MKDFIMAALPWVIMGIIVVIVTVNQEKARQSYMGLGICIGMCVGVAAGSMDLYQLGYTIPFVGCILAGELIGLNIRKQQ